MNPRWCLVGFERPPAERTEIRLELPEPFRGCDGGVYGDPTIVEYSRLERRSAAI